MAPHLIFFLSHGILINASYYSNLTSITRQSSCVTTRGVPPAAYSVLLYLFRGVYISPVLGVVPQSCPSWGVSRSCPSEGTPALSRGGRYFSPVWGDTPAWSGSTCPQKGPGTSGRGQRYSQKIPGTRGHGYPSCERTDKCKSITSHRTAFAGGTKWLDFSSVEKELC